ncbi:hypothetical protein Dimus_010764 [Dionaea muscipula]
MDLAGILKVMNERGGGHINKSFEPLLDSTTEAVGTFEVPVKKVSRKKKTAASEAGTAATTGVADVVEKEVPSEGTVGITQQSEVVVDKGMTKPKPKRLKKKGVISPAVRENLMEIEEALEEEAAEEEMLRVRSRRRQQTTSSPEAKGMDSEETKSDEVISKEERIKKRHQKEQGKVGPFKRLRKTLSPTQDVLLSASDTVGENKEEEEEVRVAPYPSSPTAAELDKELDELLAQAFHSSFIPESLISLDALVHEQREENLCDQLGGSDVDASKGEEKEDEEVEEDEEEGVGQREGKGTIMEEGEEVEEEEDEDDENDEDVESEEGGARRPPSRKFHPGVLSRHRLTMPHKRMMRRYADVLLGSSSRGVRMALDSLPRTHELSLLMRNIAELSALSGHSLKGSLRMEAIRKRYRKEIRRVNTENNRLNKGLTSEKQRLVRLAATSMQLKANVEQITNEKKTVEEENKRLKVELEKEKAKGKRSRERLVLLHNDLSDKNLKNERFNDALNETSGKLIKDYENEVLSDMDFKEELYESHLRLSEADDTIQSLYFEMENLEDQWKSKTRFLEGELEMIRATMISYAILEDTSTSSSDKQVEDPSPIVVEDPMSAIIVYEPPLKFEEEDRESVGVFEISSSEDVDLVFND